MITLGRLVEEVTGEPMGRFLEREVFGPLGMRDTGYRPDPARCAPTSGGLAGTVHDPLARSYGSRRHQPGNAGLFSTGDDLAAFCIALLSGRIVRRRTISAMFTAAEGGRGLGWRVWRDPPWAPGVGHTGYTGTLIWMRPETGRFAVLLTNRVYPDDTSRVTRLRRAVLAHVNPPGETGDR